MSISQRLRKYFHRETVIRLQPERQSRGTVSLSYVTAPFKGEQTSLSTRGHTNAFECAVIAESYRRLGFAIDVVEYTNTDYVPPADCRLAIDIHSNLERWHPNLPADCKRVLHATGAHWLTWNLAELQRLKNIFIRRGVNLKSWRQAAPSKAIDVAEIATVIGNDWTMGTFAFSGKPMHRVVLSSAYEYDWAIERDFEIAKRSFVWLGSYGMVHKGLDLALEAFARMPEYTLTVCGRPEKEADFFELYKKELTATPNIKFAGWMDLESSRFEEIRRTHGAMIYPSSAEGCAGSVVHCAHAGLVPITTRETGFDLGEYGMSVAEGTVEAVCDAVRKFATLPTDEAEARARRTWEFARATHTRPNFETDYRVFAEKLMGKAA